MATSFCNGQSYSKSDSYYELEHDDYMDADDYERREYYRNGWDIEHQERQRFWFSNTHEVPNQHLFFMSKITKIRLKSNKKV